MNNPLDNDDRKDAPSGPNPPTVPVTPIDEVAPEPKRRDTATAKKKRGRGLTVAIILASLVAIGGGTFTVLKLWPQAAGGKVAGTETTVRAEAQGPLAPFVKGSLTGMATFATPKPIDNLTFADRNNKPLSLADFKGKVVVLNLWATWCAPCRYEMPTLASLQKHYPDKSVTVIALSGDDAESLADVKSFMDVQQPLEVYVDPSLIEKTARLEVQGLPSTLILNKKGQLVARLDGEATWDTPEVKALLDKLRAE